MERSTSHPFTQIDSGPAVHNHDVSQLSDASIGHKSAMRKISMAKLLRHEIERNLHNWWAVYDQKMQHYKSNRDELMCTNHAQLVAWLEEIKPQIEKANFTMFFQGRHGFTPTHSIPPSPTLLRVELIKTTALFSM